MPVIVENRCVTHLAVQLLNINIALTFIKVLCVMTQQMRGCRTSVAECHDKAQVDRVRFLKASQNQNIQ